MNNNTNLPQPNGQAPNGADPTSQALTSTGQAPNEPHQTPPTLSREDLEQIVAKLRSEAAEQRTKLRKFEDERKKQEQAAQAALEERLKQQGEYQQLAEQHATRVKELEPVQERYSALAAQVQKQIDAEIKEWPAEAKLFDPGKDAPIEQRYEWMSKARQLVTALQQQARAKLPANTPNPKPSGPLTAETLQARFEKQLRGTGKY